MAAYGSAGGGKSYGLLLTPLRYKNVPDFTCAIFRKNFKQIFNPGGLWDETRKVYGGIAGAEPKYGRGEWWFRDSEGNVVSKVTFAHIDRDEDLHSYQGSQIAEIGFDELTHFSRSQFFYMLSRNRSTCGVRPFVRATCNPDADSWVADFISWWIDQETGYPIPERSGKIRYFVRRGEQLYWANKKETLWKKLDLKTPEERAEPRSVTFIMSSVYDNKALLSVDPQYLANLKAMAEVERERLLHGNWKIKAASGLIFKRSQVRILEAMPADIVAVCRAWDIAATEENKDGDPDYTSGTLMGRRANGSFVVLDVINQRIKAGEVERLIYNTSVIDRNRYGYQYTIRIPQDPGAAGKIVAESYIKMLAGFPVKAIPVSGSKVLRATPLAAQWQNGNVDVMAADWNDAYFIQLESFPESSHDDMVDTTSDAFNELSAPTFNLANLL